LFPTPYLRVLQTKGFFLLSKTAAVSALLLTAARLRRAKSSRCCRSKTRWPRFRHQALEKIEDGAGRFPQVAGITFTVDLNKEPFARVSDVTVARAPVDDAATYLLATSNYVRNGGDGYAVFEDVANAYDFGPRLSGSSQTTLSKMGLTQPTPIVALL
jgi:hypothetical protein